MTNLQNLLLAKPGTFAQEDVPGAAFSPRVERVVRFLVARDGHSRTQRPQRRSGRHSHDYDFYFPNRHACGIVLYSRHSPDHEALGKGWFVSQRDLDRLNQGLIGGNSYGHIVYAFKSGEVFWVNANVALQIGNYDSIPLVTVGGDLIPGVHVKPLVFCPVGSLTDPDYGDGLGPLSGDW